MYRVRISSSLRALRLLLFRWRIAFALSVLRRYRSCRQLQSSPTVSYIGHERALEMGYTVLSVEYRKKSLMFGNQWGDFNWWEATYRGVSLEGFSWEETFIVPGVPTQRVTEDAEFLKRRSIERTVGPTA